MVGQKVSIGLTTIIGWAVTLAGVVPIVSKVLQDGSAIAVHGPERWLLLISVGIGGLVSIGRFLQSAAGVSAIVKAHVTTYVGYLIGLGGLVPILIKAYGEGAQALHGPEKYLGIASVVFLAVTTIGRYLQTLPFVSAVLAHGGRVGARAGIG